MPIPSKPCPGELSPETQQLLRKNRDRAQWGNHPCDVCGQVIGVEQTQGNGFQSGIGGQWRTRHARCRWAESECRVASPSRASPGGMNLPKTLVNSTGRCNTIS
jgi:hypothetical protein